MAVKGSPARARPRPLADELVTAGATTTASTTASPAAGLSSWPAELLVVEAGVGPHGGPT